MPAFASIGCAAILSAAAFGQSVESPSGFEAADVHESAPARNAFMRGPRIHGGLYEIRIASVVDLISKAYGINENEILGGPSWIEMDRFDVIGKLPPKSTQESAKPMLQALLADRFKLVLHKDNRPMPAFALTAGKHPQLKQSDGPGDGGCQFMPPPQQVFRAAPDGAPPPPPMFSFNCHGLSMARFAEEVRDMADLQDKPVVDRTGLEGAWDFTLKFTPQFVRVTGDTLTIQEAIDKQLGLKLESVTVPVPVLVVDSVNRKPTANAPNVAEILRVPPLPTEFEVAEVKPTNPEFRGRRMQIQNGGRVNMSGMTLKSMILQAWNLSDEMIIGAPKWLDQDRYDIVAKASTTGAVDLDFDNVWFMLRALLKERLKMESHMEERPVNAYTLIAVKPKMQKADPQSRTRYKEGPGPDGKDPRIKNPILARLVTVQNMTMEQFAAKLQNIASGYIHAPVLDATGLEGSWNFTLSFSPAGATLAGAPGGRGGDAPPGATEAADPSGAVTLFDAIDKLGLKLQLQKRPASVLVIDHIEQKPTEN